MPRHGAEKPDGETRLDRIEKWFRNEPILSVVIFIGVLIAGAGQVVKNSSDILIATGLKQEKTLELANDTAKAEFSRKLVELAWRRLFWTRNFVHRVELGRPPAELDYSWNKYLDTVADWSAEIMVNINASSSTIRTPKSPRNLARSKTSSLPLKVRLYSFVCRNQRTQVMPWCPSRARLMT